MAQGIVLIIVLAVIVELLSCIPYFVGVVGLIIAGIVIYNIAVKMYVESYFSGEEFKNIKEQIKENTKKCNELNSHIEDLKKAYIKVKSSDYGKASYYDNSDYNFKRPNINKLVNDNQVYNCSLSICKNAKIQPFKYFCKYFNVTANEETLEKFEEVFNNFAAVDQGKVLLRNERERILKSINNDIPQFIYKNYKERLLNELGFSNFNFNDIYYPTYSFVYVSAGGNSSMKCDINLNASNLEHFIEYLSSLIEFKNSIAGQRALMTSALREKIKKRDKYTCQKCGLSTKDEPNLLLEIDHIIPVSKGGITSEDNLQTLCWKCNRRKGNKIIEENKK
jgi:hypothetical protein